MLARFKPMRNWIFPAGNIINVYRSKAHNKHVEVHLGESEKKEEKRSTTITRNGPVKLPRFLRKMGLSVKFQFCLILGRANKQNERIELGTCLYRK